MAIDYVGGTSVGFLGAASGTQTISLTGLTGGIASSPGVGDLVLVHYGSGSTASRTLTINSMDASFASDYSNGTTVDTNFVVGYKFVPAGGFTSFTVNNTGSAQDAGAVIVQVFRGVDTTTPFYTGATFLPNTGTARPDPISSAAPTGALAEGAWFVAAGVGGHNTGTQTFTSSDLTDFITLGSNDTNDVTLGAGYAIPTASPVNIAQFGFTGTDNAGFACESFQSWMKPAAAVGGKIKVWTGSAWVEKPVKVWNGSAWVEKPLKFWNGSAWVLA